MSGMLARSRSVRFAVVPILALALSAAALPGASAGTSAPRAASRSAGDPVGTPLSLGHPASSDGFVPGEVLVTFARRTTRSERGLALSRRVAGSRIAVSVAPGVSVVELPVGTSVQGAAARLQRDPAIAWAEPNWVRHPLLTPNDPLYGTQWGIPLTGVDDAWDTTTGDPGTVIAIVDTGVDTAHPDLDDNLWANPDETAGNGLDDDGNGLVDDVVGWDFIQDDDDPSDAHDHGTHVAGIAAAEGDNGAGISGVCPECSIMVVRAGNANGLFPSAASVAAIRYAAEEGADVINLSFGGPQWSRAERNAVRFAGRQGSLVVAAAGNSGSNNDTLTFVQDPQPAFLGPMYPASYDLPAVLAVAASNDDDRYASFSNRGQASVDVAAPGVGIRSTVPDNGYATESGTSMASPFVAGLAALLRTHNAGWTAVQTKNAIMNAVDMPGSLTDDVSVTNGRVNALTAITSPDTTNATPGHDGVMSNASRIRSRRSGSVAMPADVNDIYRKRLRRGRVYAVLLQVPRRRDFDLFVWKPGAMDTFPTDYGCGSISCFLQTGSILGSGRDEYVEFRARRSGLYLFHVSAYRGRGNYTLFVGAAR